MRFAVAVAALTLSLAGPAAAQTDPNGSSAGHSFGTITCPQRVPCPSSGNPPLSSSELAANASACITQYTGYTSESGFFNETMGIGGDNCLTSKPNTIPKGMGAQLSPRCCVIELQESVCAFRCDMMTAQ